MRGRARSRFHQALPLVTDLERLKVEDKLKKVIGRLVYKPGLVGEYFADEAGQKKVLTRRDYTVDFNWGLGSPAPEVPVDHFSVRWQGSLIVPQNGVYTLSVRADDGARVYIGGKKILDTWTTGVEGTVEVSLTTRPYQLKLESREGSGPAMMIFGWKSAGVHRVVPMEWLYHEEQLEKLLAK